MNAFAPEHLQLALSTPRADEVAARITNAGEVLVGQHTPFSAANFVLGVPASLPTSGFAAVSSGITAARMMSSAPTRNWSGRRDTSSKRRVASHTASSPRVRTSSTSSAISSRSASGRMSRSERCVKEARSPALIVAHSRRRSTAFTS
ncbi:MAG: histidinol dehydrogenase [Actinomycetota bacterium]